MAKIPSAKLFLEAELGLGLALEYEAETTRKEPIRGALEGVFEARIRFLVSIQTSPSFVHR